MGLKSKRHFLCGGFGSDRGISYDRKEIPQLNSFLVERKKLPELEKRVSEKLGYNF